MGPTDRSHDAPIALVTGSTSGIGTALAARFASIGHQVILHGRDAKKVEVLRDRLEVETDNRWIDTAIADLAVMDEVRGLGSRILSRYPRLDVLVHNAGIYDPVRRVTVDGHERTLAVNHLAPFLLTETLRSLFEHGEGTRIVTVSSRAHQVARLDLDDLGMERFYVGWIQYANTKLMNLLWTRRLARTFDPERVTANAYHPGMVRTRLARRSLLLDLVFRLGRSPKKGADTGIWLGTDPGVAGTTGGFYAERRPARTSRTARDEDLAERLWERTRALVLR